MLRITENFENGYVIRLRLDGSLTTDSYAELDKVFSRYHQGKRIDHPRHGGRELHE